MDELPKPKFETPSQPIAIVGAACRLPGEASSLRGLWDMISAGRTAHGRVPKERWDADAWYHPDPDRKGTVNTTSGFFLEQDVAAFDAPFFSVTAKEAAGMDPAKRLLLEVSYESFENAGMPVSKLSGSKTGVYVGCMTNDYERISTMQVDDQPHMAASGLSAAMMANRVSWFYNLRGPSLTLDTACSSSLYALHLACQSLRLEETDMSLVAGANLILHASFMHQLTAMHMLSPDGISHSLEERANGYGRGEGVCALVVKRLGDAVRDGDVIRAVIRGTAVNVGGKTPSVTMPSTEAQAELIMATYRAAGLPLGATRYVELHGTGTALGDPMEVSAVSSAFGTHTSPEHPVYVGSIKPNIGHTEGCAGLAGVIKAMLSLESGMVLPTAGVETVNPKLRLSQRNLEIPRVMMPWPTPGQRRISVNSFGFGGANAHVILDDAYHFLKERDIRARHSTAAVPDPRGYPYYYYCHPSRVSGRESNTTSTKTSIGTTGKKLLVLSAPDQAGAVRVAESYGRHFAGLKDRNLGGSSYHAKVAFTLASRRTPFETRAYVVAESTEEASSKLVGTRLTWARKRPPKQNGVVYVYTGQGAQWAGMGQELFCFPVFAESILRSRAYLVALGCRWDLVAEMKKTFLDNSKNNSSNVDLPEYSQPICTALQIALTEMLEHWGVSPRAVVGHSSGEIAAAYTAGIISHKDAMTVAYLRGVYAAQAARSTRRGAMLAAGISRDEAAEVLASAELPQDSVVVVACVNSPQSVTLSGDCEAIARVESLLSRRARFARQLHVSAAYHSPHLDAVAEACREAMNRVGFDDMLSPKRANTNTAKSTLFFSSVSGALASPQEMSTSPADYFVRNMTQPVEFLSAVQNLLTYSELSAAGLRKTRLKWNCLVEIGSHSALRTPLRQIMQAVDKKLVDELPYVSMMVRGENAADSALNSAGMLWALGNPVALGRVNCEEAAEQQLQDIGPVVDLPAYPWNHDKRFWHESASAQAQRLRRRPRSDLLGAPVDNQNPFEPQWRNFLRVRENPWIPDHAVSGTVLYPAAGMLVMAIEALRQLMADSRTVIRAFEFKDVRFERGLAIYGDGAVETLLSFRMPTEKKPGYGFTLFSTSGTGAWTKHCTGSISVVVEEEEEEEEEEQRPDRTHDSVRAQWNECLESRETLKEQPHKSISVRKFYRNMHAVGLEYGEPFQNLAEIVAVPQKECCFGSLEIPDSKSLMPMEYEFPHLIHPTTLDSMFHFILAALCNGAPRKEHSYPVIPSRIQNLWISNHIPKQPGELLCGYSRKLSDKSRHYTADLVMSDAAWSEPRVIACGLVMTKLAAPAESQSTRHVEKRCATIAWKLDPDVFAATSPGPPRGEAAATMALDGVRRLRDWLEVESHKSADQKVLFIDNGSAADITGVVGELRPLWSGASSPYRGAGEVTIATQSEGASMVWSKTLGDALENVGFRVLSHHQEITKEILGGGDFDLIIAEDAPPDSEAVCTAPNPDVSRWVGLAKPGGRLLLLNRGGRVAAMKASVDSSGPHEGALQIRPIELSKGSMTILSSCRDEFAPPHKVVYILMPKSPMSTVEGFRDSLGQGFRKLGVAALFTTIDDVGDLPRGSSVISTLDIDSARDPLVTSWSSEEFHQFQELLSTAGHLLWISQGAQMLRATKRGLSNAPVTGLLRVLRNEYPQIAIGHLDFSPSSQICGHRSSELVLQTWLRTAAAGEQQDMEYAEVDGQILVPRLVVEPAMDREIALANGTAPPELSALAPETPLYLEIGYDADHASFTEEPVWRSDDRAVLPLRPDEVEIHVLGVSAAVDAQSVPLVNLGSQATGIVARRGSEALGKFSEGDHVLMLGAAGLKTRQRQHYSLVQKIPKGITTEQDESAATVAWLYVVAGYILEQVLRLEPGETILICEGAAVLVSETLLRLARRLGAVVFTTARDGKERDRLVRKLGLAPERVIVSSRPRTMANALLRANNGNGVAAVVAPAVVLGAETDRDEAMRCLADFGRFVSLVRGGDEDGDHGMSWKGWRRNMSVAAVDPNAILSGRREVASRLLRGLPSVLWDLGSGSGTSVTKFAVADLLEALDWASQAPEMEREGVVFFLDFKDETKLPVAPPPPPLVKLNPTGTYILAGGLGAIGSRIANLMVQHGATRLVLLSRPGADSNSRHEEKLARLRDLGCSVEVVKCDVTQFDQVTGVVRLLESQGSVIKGVVHGAMILQDGPFETMTDSQWHRGFDAKFLGTRNLHDALPKAGMDFFILLSSVVAVMGNISQANYAAGNGYMDAIAHWRRRQGLPACSFNIGLVLDSGHTIDGTSMDDYLDRFGHLASVRTSLGELEVGILAAMRGCTADGNPLPAQLIYGIDDKLRRADQWSRDPKFAHRLEKSSRARTGLMSGGETGDHLATQLREASSQQIAGHIVLGAMKCLLAPGLQVQPADIGDDKPLYDLGVDSFRAIEIRNHVVRELKSDISVFEILSPTPLAELAALIVVRSQAVPSHLKE